jgi:glycosyltransferase involved in cell wall biosynthesis
MFNLLVITYIPSPYQVELFNAIAERTCKVIAERSQGEIALSGKFKLTVAYLQASCDAPIAQKWQQPDIQHDHLILGDYLSGTLRDRPENFQQLEQELDATDLVVFNYYQHPRLGQLMDRCLELNKPWCFWGERPGFKHSGLLGWLYRRWKLASLHESSAPIWGVGIWGVEQYRREFGISRTYFDLPYFSNLNRFSNPNPSHAQDKRVFLYSGALIERKGVDLLAAAFGRLAEKFDHLELHFLGDGDLRPALEKQLAKYSDQVKFHGFQPWVQLPHYYHQADILCVPSRYDGWGMVIPEGLAAGLPVIGTDSTCAAIELIKDGHNGWLIDADSEESLYEAMFRAIKLSPEELANYSRGASDRAASHSLSYGVQRFEQAAMETIQQFAFVDSPQGINTKRLIANN